MHADKWTHAWVCVRMVGVMGWPVFHQIRNTQDTQDDIAMQMYKSVASTHLMYKSVASTHLQCAPRPLPVHCPTEVRTAEERLP